MFFSTVTALFLVLTIASVSAAVDCNGVTNGTSVVDDCGVCNGNSMSCVDCAGMPNGTSIYDACDICNGDGTTCCGCVRTPVNKRKNNSCSTHSPATNRTCCINYSGVPDPYWDFVLLPVTLDNLIEKFQFTSDIFQWLSSNLPDFNSISTQISDLNIGRMAEFNRLFMEECLEEFCEKSATIYTQLVYDNAIPSKIPAEYIPQSHLNGPLGT